MASDDVHFLSVRGDTGETLRRSRGEMAAAARRWRGPGRRLRSGIPADDLGRAGWGIVLPEDGDPAVREALEPLVALRREEAGDLFRELTYRRGQGAGEFRGRLRSGFGPVDPQKIPYYLLLVGDPAAIPHGFQAGMDVPHAVGRLCLPGAEEYGRYAATVVAAEATVPPPPGLAVFSPSHRHDVGTRQCVQRLASSLVEAFAGRGEGQMERALIGRAATRAGFLEMLAAPTASLVLTAGHGVMYPSDHPRQHSLQGALVCADWEGEGPVHLDHLVESSVLPASLGGGARVFLLFGCFTGGTPRLDGYDTRPRRERRVLAEVPFVAELPQALLTRGALAVIAHVDQACTEAFLWEKHGQVEVFHDCLAALLDGHRLGFALEAFAERYADLATEMLEGAQEMGDGDSESLGLRLWTAYQDARGMAVLGDPAVRLAA